NLGSLTRVLWREPHSKGEETTVELLREADDSLQVTVRRTGGEPKEGEEKEEKKDAPRVFPGSSKAKELLEALTAFEGDRALGKLSDEERAKFGLNDEKAKSLSLSFEKRELEVVVGVEAYGTGSYYVSPPSGEVFLVGSKLLSPLRHGGGVLLDRRVLGVEREEIRRIEVRTSNIQREFVHRYPDDSSKAYYADPAEPDVRLEQTTGWLDRVLRLRTQQVVDATPSGSAELTVEVFGQGGSLATVELWRKDGAGKSFARASRFDDTLELNAGTLEKLLDDAQQVLEEQ
ncbi:MAG: DUF4340 domain-containing protein, partial [Myxococcota bacterium]